MDLDDLAEFIQCFQVIISAGCWVKLKMLETAAYHACVLTKNVAKVSIWILFCFLAFKPILYQKKYPF